MGLAVGALLAGLGVRLTWVAAPDWLGARLHHALGRPRPPLGLAIVGLVGAALVHSSSVVSVATLALVGARRLSSAQGLAVMLGANLGTTVTGQFVSVAQRVDPGPALLAVGIALAFAGRHRTMAALLVGFAALVEGIGLLAWSLAALAGGAVSRWLEAAGSQQGPVACFLAGWAVTAIVQSSTVVTTTVVSLAASGLVSSPAAVGLVLGSNVGTATTGLVASLLLGRQARRLAVLDLLSNLVASWVLTLASGPVVAALEWVDSRPERVAANAHSLLNLCTLVALLPWVQRLGRWVERD